MSADDSAPFVRENNRYRIVERARIAGLGKQAAR